jgi:prepilin-type N-terminal cleavage/methylation domain-containing protein
MVKMIPVKGHASASAPEPQRGGFTIVEVIIAIIVLAVGLLGMAGTTALVVRQITLADVATERAAAVQSTIERLRALPFDSVSNGSQTVGIYQMAWTVTAFQNQWKVVDLISTGPGMATRGGFPVLSPSVPDTIRYRIVRP